MFRLFVCVLFATGIASALPPETYQPERDWLVQPQGFKASVTKDEARNEVTLSNGLIRRTFQTGPGFATTAFELTATGESLIRAVRPEGAVTLDGRRYDIGGLSGQPNQAFLTEAWLKELKPSPDTLRFIGMSIGAPVAPFAWKQIRHHAPDATWPPKGAAVKFDFEVPATDTAPEGPRKLLWEDHFTTKLDPAWKVTRSKAEERVSFDNEGKAGEIYAPANVHCFADRPLPADAQVIEVGIDAGTDTGTSWGPGLGLVFDDRVVKVNLRPGDRGEHGQFELRDDGAEKLAKVKAFTAKDGGLSTDQPYRLRARLDATAIHWEASLDREPFAWQPLFDSPRPTGVPKSVRVGKADRKGGASDETPNGEWSRSHITSVTVYGAAEAKPAAPVLKPSLIVSVHYEIYDGIPLLVKWITVSNNGTKPVRLDKLNAETLALVEARNHSDLQDEGLMTLPQSLRVETDMAFGSFDAEQANSHIVRIGPDPSYKTQVNYELKEKCLLTVEPDRGPSQDIAPGTTFESFRVYELGMDSSDRERRSLSYRRMMRTISPWVTENPLMMHMRDANPEKVRAAIDQCAEVGFEMLILSFGSGFNAESNDPAYLASWKQVAEHGKSKGIELGCYSLYASRSVGGGNDMVPPKDKKLQFGNCPAVTSPWGQSYLGKLEKLFDATGFTVFEHDGPYPGDVDVTPRPPLQRGADDSQWVHWRIWSDFYRDLRAKGVFINAPDYYYASGSNKCGMGYRETNWSLPRAQQLIHARQNIFDGTWEKTPSMGWMFVPLSVYHGGGAAATIEPLDEHIEHYEAMMMSNLAAGVQACYRGPRLYDTPRVRDMIVKNVTWFKANRDLLESDVLHLRRANGRTLDGLLHVNPALPTQAMLAVFNPTDHEITETWNIPLYYAGIAGDLVAAPEGKEGPRLKTDRFCRIQQELKVPAGGFRWITYAKR